MPKRARRPPEKYGYGVARLLHIEDGQTRQVAETWNTWQYSWTSLAAQLFANGNLAYQPSSFYVLFVNGGTAGSIAIPTITRSSGVAYFQGLAGSGTTDYLRLPFLTPGGISVASGYSSYLPANLGNQIDYLALATGPTGVNGLAFSNAAGSVVIGVAIVATPTPTNVANDIAFTIAMYASNQQTAVPVSGNLAVSYSVAFP